MNLKMLKAIVGLVLMMFAIPVSLLFIVMWGSVDLFQLIVTGFHHDILWARIPWAIFKIVISVPIGLILGFAMFGGGMLMSGFLNKKNSILSKN